MKQMSRKVFSVLVAIVFIFTSSMSVFADIDWWNEYSVFERPEVNITSLTVEEITVGQPFEVSAYVNNPKGLALTLTFTGSARYSLDPYTQTGVYSRNLNSQKGYTATSGWVHVNFSGIDNVFNASVLESIYIQCNVTRHETDPGDITGTLTMDRTITSFNSPATVTNGSESSGGDKTAPGGNEKTAELTVTNVSLSALKLVPENGNITVGQPFKTQVYVNVNKANGVYIKFSASVSYKNVKSGEFEYETLKSQYASAENSKYVTVTFDAIKSKSGYKVYYVKIDSEITGVEGGNKVEPYFLTKGIELSNIKESGAITDNKTPTPNQPANPSNPGSSQSTSSTVTEYKDFSVKDVFKGTVYSQLIVDGPILDSIDVTKDGKIVTLKKSNTEILNRKDYNPPIAGPNAGETVTSEYTVRVTYTGTASATTNNNNTNNSNNNNNNSNGTASGSTTKTETVKTENFAEVTAVVPTTTLQVGQEYNVTIKVNNATSFPVNVGYEQLLYNSSGSKKGWERGVLSFDSNSEKTVTLRVPYTAEYKKVGLRLSTDKDAKSTSVSEYKVSQKFTEAFSWDGSRWNAMTSSSNKFSKAQNYTYYNKSSHANVLTKVTGSETIKNEAKTPKSKGKYVGEMIFATGTAEVKYSGTAYKVSFNKNTLEFVPVDINVPTVTLSDAKIESSTIEYGKTYEASVVVNNPEGGITKLSFTPIFVTYKNGKVTESRQSSVQAIATGTNQVVKVTLPEMKNKNTSEVKIECKVNSFEYFSKAADTKKLGMLLTPAEEVANSSAASQTEDSEVSLESAEITDSTVKLESGCSVQVDLDNTGKRHIVLKFVPEFNSNGQTVTGTERYFVTNKNGSFSVKLSDLSTAGLSSDLDNTTVKVRVEVVDTNDITVTNGSAETEDVAVKQASQWAKLAEKAVESGEWTKLSAGVTTTTREVVVNNPSSVQNNQQQSQQQQQQQTTNNTTQTSVGDSEKRVSISELSFEPITQGKSYKTKVYLSNQKGAESVTLEYSMRVEFKKPSGSSITYVMSPETVVKDNKFQGWVETTLYVSRDYNDYSASKVTITCKIDKVVGGAKADSSTSLTASKDYDVTTTTQTTNNSTQTATVLDSEKKVSISSLTFEPVTQGQIYKAKVYLNNQKGAEKVKLNFTGTVAFKNSSGQSTSRDIIPQTVEKSNFDGWVEVNLYVNNNPYGYSASKVTIKCEISEVIGGVKASSGTSITESKDYQVVTQTTKQETWGQTTSTPARPADQKRTYTVSEKYRWNGSNWEYAGQTDSVPQTIEYGGWILKKSDAKVLSETIRAATWPDRTYYPNPGGSTGAIEYPTKYEVEATYTPDRVK